MRTLFLKWDGHAIGMMLGFLVTMMISYPLYGQAGIGGTPGEPKLDAFEFDVPSNVQSEELKGRKAVLENNVFPQVKLGDKFMQQKDFQSAFLAYQRAASILTKSDLGSGPYVISVQSRISARMLEARKQWGLSVFNNAKKVYLAALVAKKHEDAMEGFKTAEKIALSALPAYYAGKTEKEMAPSVVGPLTKSNPAFNDNVQAFVMDCNKMSAAYDFKNETSLEAVDPDYKRRNEEVAVLLKQGEVYYNTKQYEKVRSNMEKILVQDPYNQKALTLLNKTYKKLYLIGMARSDSDAIERMAEVEWKWNEPIPPVDSINADNAPREISGTRAALYDKLQKIIVDKVEYESSDIQSILEHLAKISKQQDPEKIGVSIIPPSSADLRTRKIQYLELEQMPLLDIIKYVCEIAGLKYKIDDKAVIVGVKPAGDMELAFFPIRKSMIQRISVEGEGPATKEEKKTGKLSEATEKFADKSLLDEVKDERKTPEVTQEMLKNYFTPMGITFDEGSAISYDSKTGKLIVKNTPENLRKMETLLKEIDIPPPLVLVESKILEVTMTTLEELGFDWVLTYTNTDTNHTVTFAGLDSSTFYRNTGSHYVVSGLKLIPNFGNENQFDLSLSIRAIDQKDRSEMLGAPRLLVASGYTAKLEVAEERYFPDSWTDPEVEIVNGTSYTYTPPTPEFGDSTPVGTIFTVTPTVGSNNYTIVLNIETDITRMTGWSNYDYSIIIGGLMTSLADRSVTNLTPKMKMPEFSKRYIKSTVKIYDGETVVIGGILEDIASRVDDRWPIIGDVPLIGRLFANGSSASVKTNLLIFVTARLMKGNGLPVREARKQGLFEFGNR